MSALSSDLEQFLEVVDRVAGPFGGGAGPVAEGWSAVESAGLPTLAVDTAEESDALQWLGHTTRVVAASSPSLAFVLAARYAADLALGDDTSVVPTFALMSHTSNPVVATSPVPDRVVVLDIDDLDIVSATWTEAESALEAPGRTGLAAARPADVVVAPESRPVAADPAAVLRTWDLLVGSALLGIAERVVRETQGYVQERHQFGVPIGSFAGLRALVAGMVLRVEPARAQLDLALTGSAPEDTVAALAGRAAVDNCLDAVQAHGGYGYMAEYPVADLLRDAVSLQARSGGRRLHVARVALRRLGAPAGRPS